LASAVIGERFRSGSQAPEALGPWQTVQLAWNTAKPWFTSPVVLMLARSSCGISGAAGKAGVTVLYNAWAKSLLHSDAGVHGVVVTLDGVTREFHAGSVVLACGGFEANAACRARHLGPGWDLAKVRGSKYNTGDGLQMAMDIGAQPWGHWSGCHSVARVQAYILVLLNT
jgi:hypothetical protein